MPFRSEKQRRFLWARHPEIARRWQEEYGTPENLPLRAGGKRKPGGSQKKAADSSEGDMTFEEKIIDAFQLAGAALERADKIYREKQARDQAISELIPSVVEALIRHGRIEPTEKEAASRALRDPVKTLEILARTAAHRNVEEEAKLGQPADRNGSTVNGRRVKRAADGRSGNGFYIGSRPSALRESDLVLFRGLGLPDPTE